MCDSIVLDDTYVADGVAFSNLEDSFGQVDVQCQNGKLQMIPTEYSKTVHLASMSTLLPMRMMVTLFDHEGVSALIDTGSQKSLVSEDLLSIIQQGVIINKALGESTKIDFLVTVNLELVLGNLQVLGTAVVVAVSHKIALELVLGTDFLKKHKCALDRGE